MKNKILKIIILISALSLSTGLVVSGWTGSTDSPPYGNVPAPIHIGDETQTKEGAFVSNDQITAGSFFTAGNIYGTSLDVTDLYVSSSGNVGIGTTNPGSRLDVNGSLNVSSGNFQINNGYISNDGTNQGLVFDIDNNATFTQDLNIQGDIKQDGMLVDPPRRSIARKSTHFVNGEQEGWIIESGNPSFTGNRVNLSIGDIISSPSSRPFVMNERNQSFHATVVFDDIILTDDCSTYVYQLLTDSNSSNSIGFVYEILGEFDGTTYEDPYGPDEGSHYITIDPQVKVYGHVGGTGSNSVLLHTYNGETEITNELENEPKKCSIQMYDDKIDFKFGGYSATYSGSMPSFDNGFGSVEVTDFSPYELPVQFDVLYWDRMVYE